MKFDRKIIFNFYGTQRQRTIMALGQLLPLKGSGGGSVGRAVASDSRGLQFKSSHRQKCIYNIYCELYWKDENKEKEAGNCHLKKHFNDSNLLLVLLFKLSFDCCKEGVVIILQEWIWGPQVQLRPSSSDGRIPDARVIKIELGSMT